MWSFGTFGSPPCNVKANVCYLIWWHKQSVVTCTLLLNVGYKETSLVTLLIYVVFLQQSQLLHSGDKKFVIMKKLWNPRYYLVIALANFWTVFPTLFRPPLPTRSRCLWLKTRPYSEYYTWRMAYTWYIQLFDWDVRQTHSRFTPSINGWWKQRFLSARFLWPCKTLLHEYLYSPAPEKIAKTTFF